MSIVMFLSNSRAYDQDFRCRAKLILSPEKDHFDTVHICLRDPILANVCTTADMYFALDAMCGWLKFDFRERL